jgi:predicted acylesterase/phospholipase RssA
MIVPPVVLCVFWLFPSLLHPFFFAPWKWPFYIILVLSCSVLFGAIFSVVSGLWVLFDKKILDASDHATSFQSRHVLGVRFVDWVLSSIPRMWRAVASGTLLVAVATVFFLYWNAGGLFDGDPLINNVTERYAELFGFSGALQPKDLAERREQISETMYRAIKNGDRDLVITGSSLTAPRGAKYFYVRARCTRNPCAPPSYGTQGIEVGQTETGGSTDVPHCDPRNLVDVAMGSGTIFPIFPSYEVKSSRSMQRMDLIDGGFAHNSPTQAAVLWGATHIILVEVSPETHSSGDVKASFAHNALTAFDYLYDQAQLADVNAQEEAAVFMLRPRLRKDGTSVELLDFGPRFADYEFDLGSDDAQGWRFMRQPAAPHFWASGPQ